MKLIHAILWCFGFSVVEDNTTTSQTMSHSNSSTSSSVDIVTVAKDYNSLTTEKQLNHDQAWAEIVEKYKWNPEKAQKMLVELSNYASNMKSADDNGSVTM